MSGEPDRTDPDPWLSLLERVGRWVAVGLIVALVVVGLLAMLLRLWWS